VLMLIQSGDQEMCMVAPSMKFVRADKLGCWYGCVSFGASNTLHDMILIPIETDSVADIEQGHI